MNGIHDVGGMHGLGELHPSDEATFHVDWERRIFALNFCVAAFGLWNIDSARAAMEASPPLDYLSKDGYYARIALRLERLLKDYGLVTSAELYAKRCLEPADERYRPLSPEAAIAAIAKGGDSHRNAVANARYAVGHIVHTRNVHPSTHTRLPRYARGRTGVIKRVYGTHVFPDARVLGIDEPQWLYAVEFSASELWGPQLNSNRDGVVIDAWEPYLEKDGSQQN